MKLSHSLSTIDDGALYAILEARHGDPFAVLGMHQAGEQLVVRVLRPDARSVTVHSLDEPGKAWPALMTHGDGFFEAIIDGADQRFRYQLEFTAHDGSAWMQRDPYSFGSILGPL